MTCKENMIRDVITVDPKTSVSEALDQLFQNRIRSMPVVDKNGKYHGMFNFRTLLGRLLPSSAGIKGGLQSLAFVSEDKKFLSDRLNALRHMHVHEVMRTDIPVLSPDTVLEEAILQIYTYDTPLPVIDSATGRMAGLFTKQSAIHELLDNISEGKTA